MYRTLGKKRTIHEQEGLVVLGRTRHSAVVCACVRERGGMMKGDRSAGVENGDESGVSVKKGEHGKRLEGAVI